MNADTVKFHIGDLVTLKIDRERKGMVTGVNYRPSSVTYCVSWDDFGDRSHYDIEIEPWAEFAKKELS